MWWSLKIFGSWIFTDGPFSSRYTSSNEKLLLLYPPFKSLVEYFALELYLNIVIHIVYLIKMKVLTYTLYQEHCELCTEIHGSIAVNSCQIELAQTNILLSKASIITYMSGKPTSVENNTFINFSLSEGTYSIDEFNAKIKEVVSQQRQGWEPPQIKDLKLVIPEDYTFMTINAIFIALGIPDNYLKKATLIRSTLPPGSYKTSLDTSPPPK